jgi:LacI family transcriptional regulator
MIMVLQTFAKNMVAGWCMGESRITIKDIATVSGVSFSTVSRCLNDSPLVSNKTKERIRALAEEMGFEFNASARSLVTSHAGTIGIVLPEQYPRTGINMYHEMLMNDLRDNLEQLDLDMIITYHKNHFNGQNNIVRLVARKKVDGLIIIDEDIDPSTIEYLNKWQVPFVFSHYPPTEITKGQDVIYTDHVLGGELVADHLLEKGYRSFILIGPAEEHLEFKLREKGFCDRLENMGLSVGKMYCEGTYEGSKALVAAQYEHIVACDAVFALTDLIALGVVRALNEKGYTVPKDIALVGYDDTVYSKYNYPSLTTVHQPKEALVFLSCERLIQRMKSQREGLPPNTRLVSVPPVLMVGEST